MSNKERYICIHSIPGCVSGCNTKEDLSRYLAKNPYPEYRLVSTNWMNGNWHLVFELKDEYSK